jgi:hypothetical protein
MKRVTLAYEREEPHADIPHEPEIVLTARVVGLNDAEKTRLHEALSFFQGQKIRPILRSMIIARVHMAVDGIETVWAKPEESAT